MSGLFFVLACAAAFFLAGGCDGLFERPIVAPVIQPGQGLPVILFSAGDQGVLAACGCPSNPSGGLAKREALVEQYRGTRSAVVLVDAGDLFPEEPAPVKVKYLAMAVGQGGYDAIAVGDQEWMLGVPQLRRLSEQYKLPFICANVRDENSEAIFQPHVIREVGGVRIGIFAVMADRAFGFPVQEWRKGLKVEPPLEAARREVAELRKSCDLVIALSHQPLFETREMGQAVPGIDVIVSGHDERVLPKGEKTEGGLLVTPGAEGRLLGSLTLTAKPPAKPQLTLEMTELSAQVPDAQWVMDLYWRYVREAKEKEPPDWKDQPIPAVYESSEACGKCHPAEYKQWLTTAHAHAYASIKRTGRQDDPECVLCHTMGFGRQGGFVSMAKTPDLGRVTCQACHNATSDHVLKGTKLSPQLYINSRMCMSCHGPIQSPQFDYFVYKPLIRHLPPAFAADKK